MLQKNRVRNVVSGCDVQNGSLNCPIYNVRVYRDLATEDEISDKKIFDRKEYHVMETWVIIDLNLM